MAANAPLSCSIVAGLQIHAFMRSKSEGCSPLSNLPDVSPIGMAGRISRRYLTSSIPDRCGIVISAMTASNWPGSFLNISRAFSGFAQKVHEAYDHNLKAQGYTIRAQILNYPDGGLGDVGLYIGW